MTDPFPRQGLPLEEARARLLDGLSVSLPEETLPLIACLGRVSARPVVAAEAVPGFRASVMDGFALAGTAPAAGAAWELVGRSEPGAPYPDRLQPGEAVRILTGAPVPDGCERVVPQELARLEGDRSRLLVPDASSGPAWIRAADEEARPGDRLLEAGERLGAAHLARLAACGVDRIAVHRRPTLALLISGDELVPPGRPRGPGSIWESNGTLLEALLQRLGYTVVSRAVVADRRDPLRRAMTDMAEHADVVVSTGGVSAGDSDWIRPLLAELGSVTFWKLDLKPGRPFAFGQLKGTPFFGLPGNPVSAAVTALQLLWPALERLEGVTESPCRRWRLPLAAPIERRAGRPELMRAALDRDGDGHPVARLLGSQASSRLGSLQGADLLLEIPAEATRLEAGERVWAQLLALPLL
ncbi:molybdopterin molybdenumtransferase MoeA [Synechococcus sp. RSCCF101]|uniref:molybdopterin molybdotransferase MoeA n=1 Tax=Synechococcus sp. RSCCF101 TaxID=2511069 RepID=UPI0012490445|nr:gephyrin-like molybdotransferase Glp [Synechococcus sp. RSCCF101]QEY32611.1 molybdopterin molybdenumtransferase MoeA [Synechococcus sp. RSCCF101]